MKKLKNTSSAQPCILTRQGIDVKLLVEVVVAAAHVADEPEVVRAEKELEGGRGKVAAGVQPHQAEAGQALLAA